jgi:membrane-bound serine protease (ClpP class)
LAATLFEFLFLWGRPAVAGAASTGTVSMDAVVVSSPVPYYVLSVSGAIDPAVARYVKGGIEEASRSGAQMVLVNLDTPGGLLDATRDIVQSFLNAPLPVVLFVSPRGARATSAGVFLMMAADVAAMAPETHLGAAHPVSVGGGLPLPGVGKSTESSSNDSVMGEKAVSDSAAYIRALAEEKGRNADWAENAVRRSLSLTADEALKQNVIDVVADDQEDLFDQLQGGTIEKNGRTYLLSPVGAPVVTMAMSASLSFLHILANPNLAYILLMIGIYALIYEFASPGIGLGGVTGAICLVLAFFSLQLLPLNYAGLALLVGGLILMAVDHLVLGHGFLMTGGAVAFGLGSFLLFDRKDPAVRVSIPLILGTLAAAAAFSIFVLRTAWGTLRMKPSTGREALIGRIAEVRDGGQVFLEGQLWTADGYGPFAPGEKVRVTGLEGNKLLVEKL